MATEKSKKENPESVAPAPELPPPPYAQERLFYCRKCEFRWKGHLLVNVLISVAVAYMKSLRCPRCGANAKKVCLDIKSEWEAMTLAELAALDAELDDPEGKKSGKKPKKVGKKGKNA